MPTTYTTQFSNLSLIPLYNAEDAVASEIVVAIAPSLTLAAGTVLGKITATGKYAAYASGSVDGSQVPVGFLTRPVTTDASSNITNYSEWGIVGSTIAIYRQGTFLIADLVGLDANAVAVLQGNLDGATIAASKEVRF